MDRDTIDRVRENLFNTAEAVSYSLREVIVFGSRIREDYRPESDVDVLIVSSDFEGVKPYKRPRAFYRGWDYEALPDPEFICLTPEEFEVRQQRSPHIVRTAVEEGISLA